VLLTTYLLLVHVTQRGWHNLKFKGYEGPCLFFEAVKGPRTKTFGKHWSGC